MPSNDKIEIEVSVSIKAPLDQVWQYWTRPEHIVHWNAASAEWHTTKSENDLRIGGRLSSRMEAKDGSMGFDFWGIYVEIIPQEFLSIELGDGRKMSVEFTPDANQVEVKEIFEAEKENSIEQQRLGWQSILNNFKDYVETRAKTGFRSIEEYIACFPGETQSILKELQRVIKAAAPDAEEKISYQMPTFAQNGNLVHFAAYKNHIGFYPAPSAILAFKEDLAKYQGGKGSIQFPINEPLPYELIRRIVRFRVNENLTK